MTPTLTNHEPTLDTNLTITTASTSRGTTFVAAEQQQPSSACNLSANDLMIDPRQQQQQQQQQTLQQDSNVDEVDDDCPMVYSRFKTAKLDDIQKKHLGMTVQFDIRSYKVSLKKSQPRSWKERLCAWIQKDKEEPSQAQSQARYKTILENVQGVFEPGKLTAIMGPSGGGKTSLLNLVGGRTSVGELQGTMLFDGRPRQKSTRKQIGYVMQEDLFFSNLTARETLAFTAALNYGSTMTPDQVQAKVNTVLEKLNLEKCADTVIGDQLTARKGISGGERKRLSIGNELLCEPALLLADEPTSGLDSNIAYSVIALMKGIAKEGKTVVCSIHQPSSQVLAMFDQILLLTEGKLVYFGDNDKLLPYLKDLGYECPYGYNPADYFIQLMSPGFQVGSSEKNQRKTSSISMHRSENDQDDGKAVIHHLHSAWAEKMNSGSEEYSPSLATIEQNISLRNNEPETKTPKYPTTWWTQFKALFKRAFIQKRGFLFNYLHLIQMVAITIMIGLIWWQVGTLETSITDRLGCIFFITAFFSIWPLFQSIFVFPPERAVLNKDRASGLYCLSAYYCAKVTVETPMDLYLPLIFTFTGYWMVGFNSNFWRFVCFNLIVEFNYVVSQSIGFFLSATFMDLKKAQVASSLFLLTSMLCGGFYIDLENLPSFISWVQYLSFFKYMYNGLVVNDISDMTFECVPDQHTKYSSGGLNCPVTAENIYEVSAINPNLGTGPVIGIMIAFIVVFRVLGYVSLRLFQKAHKKTK